MPSHDSTDRVSSVQRDACGVCRFFVKHEPQHIYGDCHRMPPQFGFYANIYEPTGYGSEKKRIDIHRERGGVWPNISQDDWCGEFLRASGECASHG